MVEMNPTGHQRKTENLSNDSAEAVFLLHGLAARRWIMLRIARSLRRSGYRVTNWGYPTLWKSIDDHAQQLRKRLSGTLKDDRIDRVHFVTHSMGSIIVRRMLMEVDSDKLGRVVMLGPPNRGSNVARVLAKRLNRLCPALGQLSDAPQSYVNCMPEPVDTEVGVIAAAEDLVVPIDNTRLEALTDWTVLPGHHSVLPWRPTTVRYVKEFLRCGRFPPLQNASANFPTDAASNSSEN